MTGGTPIAVLQDDETYSDLDCEMTRPVTRGFEPIWSLDNAALPGLMRRLLCENGGDCVDNLRASALTIAIALAVVQHFTGPEARPHAPGTLSPDRLRRVLSYIDDHLGDGLSLAAIADVACLSPFHFSRCFKQSTGHGLHQFVLRRRIERAKQLIARSKMPLAEIAMSVGFDSQASFTARFHREVGLAPGLYRRELA